MQDSNRILRMEHLEERRLLAVVPRLVVDRAAELHGGSSFPAQYTEVSGQLFFVASDPATGRELWKTDGTAGGTQLVRDIRQGAASGSLTELVNAGGTLYFLAEGDDSLTAELWKSDGTESGTQLIRTFPPLNPHEGFEVAHLTAVGSTVVFKAGDAAGGPELWRSDGTTAGTYSLTDLSTPLDSVEIANFESAAGQTYFWVDARRLWRTDGTAAGTHEIANLGPDFTLHNDFGAQQQAIVGGDFYFVGYMPTTGVELWKSGGTALGTRIVKELVPGSEYLYADGFANLTVVGDEIYFTLEEDNEPIGLWKSNGSAAGTVKIADVPYYQAIGMTAWQAQLFFWLGEGNNAFHLWQSDGSAAGTIPVGGGLVSDSIVELTPTSTALLFEISHGPNDGLWRTDGSPAGTYRYAAHPQAGEPGDARALLGDLLFVTFSDMPTEAYNGFPGATGYEPWTTDGTSAGTRLLKDIVVRTADSIPIVLTSRDDKVVVAYRKAGYNAPVLGLWRTDGTAKGTVEFRGNAPYNQPTFETSSWEAEFVGDTLFFPGIDGGDSFELWKSVGAEGDSVLVKDIRLGSIGSNPGWLTNVSGTLYFTAQDTAGRQLWKSDGTEAGTVMVKAIPAHYLRGPDIRDLTNVNGTLFFTANDGTIGAELWKSDGTEAGTILVKDILPSSQAGNFTPAGNRLFFTAEDSGGGRELWVSDGSAAGTYRVKDVRPGVASSDPTSLVNVGGVVYFVANDGSSGGELWCSNGTEAGTWRVKDIYPGSYPSRPAGLVNVDGTLYFSAKVNGQPRTIWRSDGTAAGTVQITAPGDDRAKYPSDLINVQGTLYFLGGESYARQVWSSDGTAAGTIKQTNFSHGDAVKHPHNLVSAGGKAYFVADDGYSGEELWVLAEAQAGDFDADGDADGADFLRWQRGFGKLPAGPGLGADGDADNDVDGADLAIWKASFGQPAIPPSETVFAMSANSLRNLEGDSANADSVYAELTPATRDVAFTSLTFLPFPLCLESSTQASSSRRSDRSVDLEDVLGSRLDCETLSDKRARLTAVRQSNEALLATVSAGPSRTCTTQPSQVEVPWSLAGLSKSQIQCLGMAEIPFEHLRWQYGAGRPTRSCAGAHPERNEATLRFEPKESLPERGGYSPDGWNAAIVDGAVRFITTAVSATEVKAIITEE